MGTVYRRKDSPFLWIAFSRPGPDGRMQRFQQSSGYRPGQELLAERLVREIEDRIKAGFDAGVTATELTVEEFGARWHGARVRAEKWTNARLDQQAFVNHVYAAELHLIGRTVKFGGLKLGQVDHPHVIAWLEGLELKGLAGRTRASLLSLLNRMFKRAVREKRMLRNPCDGLERAETPKQADADPLWRQGARFTAAELAQLLTDERVPMDRRVFYAIGFLGGLREGEIAALRWRSYDTRRRPLGCFSVGASFTRKNRREKTPKSGRPREVPVHPVTAQLLAAWRARGWRQLFGRAPGADDLVVPNRAGSYVTDLNVTENLRRDLEVLGLRHRRFHDTKRTFVSLAREGGATPLLRWISHGPTAREMLDTYSSPDWASLCREVARVKVRLSSAKLCKLDEQPQRHTGKHGRVGERLVVKPQVVERLEHEGSVSTTPPQRQGRKAVQVVATKAATAAGGSMEKVSRSTAVPQCPGRDSNSARKGQMGTGLHVVPRPSLAATGTDGLPAGGSRSKSATRRSPPAFRGGMRIEEG